MAQTRSADGDPDHPALGPVRRLVLRAVVVALAPTPVMIALAPAAVTLALGRVPGA